VKYTQEFRDPKAAQSLLSMIQRIATQRWTIMEVCGGQTHNLLRYGIDEALHNVIELIHGPGCPVCVTHEEYIDAAIALAFRTDTSLVTFGDMLRVPGSTMSLAEARTQGANVSVVYSPLDAVQMAMENPTREIVFLAVGFETTAPATALAILKSNARGIDNFSLLSAHVCVLPAMKHLMHSPHSPIQGFLAAGHVCSVLGYEVYQDFCRMYRVPVVVTGFEPIDLLQGILSCVKQLESGSNRAENAYTRSVVPQGNVAAQELIQQVYEPIDRDWRGLGMIAQGGLSMKAQWNHYDALKRFQLSIRHPSKETLCRSGEVLSGKIKPPACSAFGTLCTPLTPMGAPMISSEGACAAYYQYHCHTTREQK
jgi:hydrogenase expression/formation protein HypD